MLAIFHKAFAHPPEELNSPASHRCTKKPKLPEETLREFLTSHPSDTTSSMTFGDAAVLAYVRPNHNSFLLHNQRMFCGYDDIYCLFMGTLNNLCAQIKQYGLSRNANEAMLVIEAYRTLRDRDKEQLLARLQELQIVFSQYEHPVVLTVEAQAKYVGYTKGGLSKNLFLKDKKQRFYVVSALAETKVDLKVLSQRLGLGRGGLRMAPEEALAEILQVPLGCVTPFALVNDSARHVSLLLDQGFKNQEFCFFHPLSNDMSISLNAHDLGKFLISIGRTPAYVDLEANPVVGKDQPPDLAALVPSDAKALDDPVEEQGATQGSEKNQVSNNNQPDVVTVAKAAIPPKASTKEKASDVVKFSSSYADTDKFVEEILEKTKSIVLSKIKDESMENNWEQLAIMVSNNISKLGVELKNVAMIFKNTAYTEGFTAGIHRQPKRM